MIPQDIALEPRPGRGALAGLTLLEGTGRALPKSDWSGRLYRERAAAPLREIPVRLIPYFAWDNRAPSDMTVWLPVTCAASPGPQRRPASRPTQATQATQATQRKRQRRRA
jgi:hypothetical protein